MDRPTATTGHTVTTCVLLLFVLISLFCSFVIFGAEHISRSTWWAVLLVVLMVLLMGALVFVILQQPENPKKLPYMAPCVPFVPAFAMLVNIYLMLKLSSITWIRFAVWCFVGLLIYFGYGMWNSTLEVTARQEEAHASTYQRYDTGVDDSFAMDEDLYPQDDGSQYQGWNAPEERGYQYQQQPAADELDHNRASQGRRPKSKGKANKGFEALVADDDMDYSPE
ncbi:hypothetical protein COCON_G00063440 [Conger conger]|uniref:Cationic amino acid transporter C-terminal domain-containing protein n=1 Tax=Conger conger TaxID=82655 RepID=A0A9Q1DRV0_CONCO|nr:hypothetical protein COCON_G00063440 [Conger conger]